MSKGRKHKWTVRSYYRTDLLTSMKNGERELPRANTDAPKFPTLRMARQHACKSILPEDRLLRIAGRINEVKRTVVEINIWDPDYSGE